MCHLGPTPRPAGKKLAALGTILQQAFRASRQYPELILNAHAHHYRRLTYRYGKNRQLPCLIAGCGGHGPLEKLAASCANTVGPRPSLPFSILKPRRA